MSSKNIIIGIIIVIAIYLIYVWLFGDATRSYLLGMHDAKKRKVISGDHFPKGNTADYTYSFWVFISNWNYRAGEAKTILARNNSDGFPAPHISLGANLNNIEVSLATYQTGSNESNKHTCSLDNIPLQTWANVIVTLNNRALDLYLDGKLVRTCVLPGVPHQSTGKPLVICGLPANTTGGNNGNGFDGYMSNVSYLSRPVNPREAYAIYREGPGGTNWFSNMFNKYRLKIAFMNENREINSFEI
tara:strand:- start:4175 stop:4909 length:735 start_codon:yes stop_codon:yes gene_type:complete